MSTDLESVETISRVMLSINADSTQLCVECFSDSGATLIRFFSGRPAWLMYWARLLGIIIQERR